MKRENDYSAMIIYYCLMIVFAITVLFFAAKSGNAHGVKFDNVYLWSDDWVYNDNAGNSEKIEIPKVTKGVEAFSIKNTISGSVSSADTLLLCSVCQNVRVYVGDSLIYQYHFNKSSKINAEFPPSIYLEVPMSQFYRGKEIRIEYENLVKNNTGIARIYLGDKAAIISSIVKKDAYTLIATVIVIMFGILSLIRYFSNGKSVISQSKAYLYKGIAMIFGALWLLNQTQAMEFFINNAMIPTTVNYLSQILLPIPFVLAVAYTEERRYFRSARIFCYATGIIDAVIFALLTSGQVMIYDVFPLIDLPLNASAFYTAITIILIVITDKKLFKKMQSTVVALSILAAAEIVEIVGQNFTGFTGIALPTGIICFALVSEVVNSSDVIKTMKMDIEFNAYKRSQKALLASVSHEIRTPINAILGLDEMIMRETNEEDIKNYAEDIKTSGNVLLSLVNDILDFSKMESGMMVLIPDEYSLAELLNEVCIMAESKAKGKNLSFITEINPEIPSKLYGDEARIRQILLNLLNNAVKYTKEGQVRFAVDYKDDGENVIVSFHVIDTGIGIRAQDIPKIGMPFLRLDEQKNKSIEGTGLGMSITNNLLGMMGSKLLITSTYGEGSDFGCEIKQKVVDKTPIGDFKAAVKNDRKEDSAKVLKARGKVFLVVDDTPMNLKVFKGLLKNSEADIYEASDGNEALTRCAERKYDIIFMDQRMPGMDGYETMRHIRYDESCISNRESPVILLTANAVAGTKEQALADGFNGYISKPIDLHVLYDTIINFAKGSVLVNEEKTGSKAAESSVKGTEKPASNKPSEAGNEAKGSDGPGLIGRLADQLGFDTETAVAGLGGDELYLSVLSDFVTMGDKNADEIESLLNNKDLKNYTIKVHALKSGARIIGAMTLSGEAREMEEMGDKAQEGNREAKARIDVGSNVLLTDYRNTVNAIKNIADECGVRFDESSSSDTAESTQEDDSTKPVISEDELKEAYEAMREMSEALDADGISSVLESLASYKLSDSEKERTDKLSDAVKRLDFTEIKELVG